jgi:hypothetical protein
MRTPFTLCVLWQMSPSALQYLVGRWCACASIGAATSRTVIASVNIQRIEFLRELAVVG